MNRLDEHSTLRDLTLFAVAAPLTYLAGRVVGWLLFKADQRVCAFANVTNGDDE